MTHRTGCLKPRRVWPAAALLWAVALLASARPCAAEVLPRAPRELLGRLAQARDAVAQGRLAEAVPALEAILTAEGDGFLPCEALGVPQRTLRAEAAALAASLEADGLEQLEAWCGAKARRLLDEAVARRDREALARVVRQFPGTAAGAEAALVLGSDGLDRGRPLEALAWLQRAAWPPSASGQLAAQWTLTAAAAHLMAGQPDEARRALDRLRSLGGVRFRVGDEEFPGADDPRRVLDAMAAALAPLAVLQPKARTGWPMFRGDSARTAAAEWSGAEGPLLWKVDVQAPAAPSAPGTSVVRYGSPRQGPALPAAQPIVAGRFVLTRTPERLVAIDLESGRQAWEFPWGGDPGLEGPGQPGARSASNPAAAQVLAQRAFDDAPYGQITSDGDRVFLVDGLSLAAARLTPVIAMVGGQRVVSYVQPKAHNRLVALDLRREGKLAWSVGAESGEDEPGLAGAFFLGPPLAHEGRLYAMAETDGDLHLVALDAATGRLEWSLLLAVPERPVLSDPQRRLAGAAPSLADGVLVCPTSAGAVVAVDPFTREILWGHQYAVADSRSRMMQLRMLALGARAAYSAPVTSADATAMIARGHVLLAPAESEELLCLDLHTGNLAWQRPLEDLLYVACAADDVVMTVGARGISGWGLRSGKPAWDELSVELPDGASTAGRGFLCGRHYYLPTTAPAILDIDVATGRIGKRIPLKGKPGNLLALGPLLVSHAPETVEAFGRGP